VLGLCYAGSLLLCGLFSSCSEWGLLYSCGVRASHHGGYSSSEYGLQGAQASVAAARRLSCRGSLQCTDSAIVVAHGLSCSVVMWDLPGSRIEPVSPALAGSLPLSLQGSPSK